MNSESAAHWRPSVRGLILVVLATVAMAGFLSTTASASPAAVPARHAVPGPSGAAGRAAPAAGGPDRPAGSPVHRWPLPESQLIAGGAAASTVYGAWAWSGTGGLPVGLSVAGGSTAAQAEASAVADCKAAGGGTSGNGPCFALAWFSNAYSSLAFGTNGAWGVSWDSTSSGADSGALNYCQQIGGISCQLVGRAVTPDTSTPDGSVVAAVPSYGVWAISPTAKLAAWGVGGTEKSARQVAIAKCVTAGGARAECAKYGAWAKNGYSAISLGGNLRWSISVNVSPASAQKLAQRECQTVKSVGHTCTVKGTGKTGDPWVGGKANLGWINEPDPTTSATFTVSATTGWQQTPIDVTAGDTYSIVYEGGTWTVDYRNFPKVGPQGYSNSVDRTIYQGCKYYPSRNYGLLLGVIGDSAQDFPIGAGGTFMANASGSLYLRVNDNDACLGDNAGSVTMYLNWFQPISPGSGADYAGYSLHPATGFAEYASAAWHVPAVSCGTIGYTEQAQMAVWVGLWGGPNTTSGQSGSWLPQAGTVGQCQNRIVPVQPRYEAVYQMFGPNPTGFKSLFPVHANDSMQALVEYKGTGTGSHSGQLKFWYDIVDVTRHAASTGYIYTARKVSIGKAAYQGGVIVERVEGNGLSGALPQFPAIAISDLRVGRSTPRTNEWTGYKWEIARRATTGALTKVPGRGDSFTVTWLHA